MDLTGWTPVRVHWSAAGPEVEWRWTGATRFADPFFEETIMRCVNRPFTLLFGVRTPLEALRDVAAERTLEPSGFVFHLSRCGSTLVAQMLAADPRVRVHSEPAAIDGVLRARLAGVPDETICEWLRWVVGALGRPSPGESAYVVKLDCWSTIDLGLFERAFPTTPWVFVYREPEEVLASHLRRPGPQVLPGVLPPQLVGVDAGSLAEITLEEYAGRVLKRIGDAALEHASSPCALLVEYADLPAAVVNHIAPHFGIEFDEAALAAVAVASTRDAKNPVLPFEPDSAAKRRELTESGRTIAQNLLRGVYDRLEAARMEALAC